MKKILLTGLIILSLFSLVFAATSVVDTIKPDISATFNESVVLVNYNLTYVVDSSDIPLSYSTADNRTFVFTPIPSLANGFYSFIVNAQDRIGNAKTYSQNILVSANETRIFYQNPRHGFTRSHPLNITLGTSKEAECRWSFQDINYSSMPGNSFSDTGSLAHTITALNLGVPAGTEEFSTTIYVRCIDSANLSVKRSLLVGFDATPPTLSNPSIVPNPVVLYPPEARIMLAADDDVICKANGGYFSTQSPSNEQTYSIRPTHIIQYPASNASNGAYSYQVTCENLAEFPVSLTAPLSVTVALQENLAIYISSPKQFTKNPLIYNITTNKDATCNATLDGANRTSFGAPKTQHSILYGGISQQSHTVLFTCTGANQIASSSFTFTVDDSPPSNVSVSAFACSADKLSIRLNASDNQSGIAGFNYSVSGANVSINSTITQQGSFDITGLKLLRGTQYVVRASAINKAGGVSQPEVQYPFIFNPNGTLACQETKPPTLRLNISDDPSGKRVTILCSDESGCLPGSISYGLSDTSNCSIQHVGDQVIVSKPQTICYAAKDIYGNNATGSQKIELKNFAVSCSNSILDGIETDIDCGGNCQTCSAGLKCSVNFDCSENYCVNNRCEKALCTDVKQNGFETDVDCGGASCESCSLGKSCKINSDCVSSYCKSGICEASSCTDSIQNGLESDVDCGGSCDACTTGSSCVQNSDCSSNRCEFSSCVAGAPTFEEWAKQHNIDPADRDKDSDDDGLSNYEEFIAGTDPFNADSDGDGVSDGDEVKAGTDPLDATSHPTSTFSRYLLLGVGLLVLILGVLFMTYFKIDQQTSINVIVIGAAAIVFVLVDLLLFAVPKPILYLMTVLAIGGAGYFTYTKQNIIIGKMTGKVSSARQVQTQGQKQSPQAATVISQQPQEKPLSKEELTATKEMIEMIRKEKQEREKRKEQVFSSFSKQSKGPVQVEKEFERLEKIETRRKESPKVTPEAKKESRSPEPQSIFDKLSSAVTGKSESDIERLGKLGKDESVEKLERLKGKDVFSKLPSSRRSTQDLEELGKRKKKR